MTAKPEVSAKPLELAILDSLSVGVMLLDAERRVVCVNRRAAELLEVTEAEVVGRNLAEIWELVLPDGAPLTLGDRPSDRVERTGVAVRDQLIGFRIHGRPLRWTLLGLSLVEATLQTQARFLIHFQLISDEPLQHDVHAKLSALVQQRSFELNEFESRLDAAQDLAARAQAELKISEELYQSVVEAMAEGVVIHEPSGQIRAANNAAARVLGLSHGQLLGREAIDSRWRLTDSEGRDLPTASIPSEITAVTGESCHRRLLGVVRGNGERAWLEINTRPLGQAVDAGPGAGRFPVVATFTDVTLEREATRALEESRARFSSVLEAVPGILFRYLRRADGRTGRFEFLSGYTKALVGLEPAEIVANPDLWFSRVHPGDLVEAQKVTADDGVGGAVEVALRVKGPNGEWRWFRNRAVRELHPKGVIWTGVMLDITEERQLASQVRASQRREAIATVVAGVAHNFNNALASMIPNLEHALESSSGEQRIELQETLRTARLAGGLVRQLMVVARQQTSGEVVVCDFANVVRDVAQLCRGLFQGRIQIVSDVTSSRVPVAQDAAQLHQMVLNLCINARDAMRDHESGRLWIQLHAADSEGARGCRLIVGDNGCGMDDETQRKLGEPFFTTKPPGQGTGLGLATVYAMVRDLAGNVECVSAPEQGTEFRIWLPRSELLPVGQSNASPPETPTGERVLLVDDEPLVRRALARGLRARGWLVEEASDGLDALASIAAGQDRFAVAVLDLSMPGMPGERVLAEMRRRSPRLPVIVLSGFVHAPEALVGAFSVLEKPIGTPQLSAELSRAVASSAPPKVESG
ncbi:MAG: PAS domain S-box protein [Myxococcales bacterium]|nr:PAS domain S-box protein [Myxococcales bacterium]